MIQILDNGIRYDDRGGFTYTYFHVHYEGPDFSRRFYRVAALRQLSVITLSPEMEQEGLLGKQWAAVRGLYNAQVDFLFSACGVFAPEHIGLVQLYGAAANAQSLEEATREAHKRLESVHSTLSGYPQSQLDEPDINLMQWYIDFISESRNPLVVMGHPDPRVKRRSMGRDGALPEESSDDLALEQNEILFRGLAKKQTNFIFQITANHIDQHQLTNDMGEIARLASIYASRQKGAINASASIAIPVMAAISDGYSGGHALGESESQSVSDGVSESWGNSHSDSLSHSSSIAETDGVAHHYSNSKSVSISESVSDNWAQGVADTASHAETNSTAHSVTDSQSHSDSSGSSWGHTEGSGSGYAYSESLSANASISPAGVGGSLSGGESESWSNSSFSSDTVGGFSSSTDTTGHAETNTVGHAVTDGVAQTLSSMEGGSFGSGVGQTYGSTQGVTFSHSVTKGSATTRGEADGVSESWGQSHGEGSGTSRSAGQSSAQMIGAGMSSGLLPGISVGRSWQTENDLAIRSTEVLRQVESHLMMAASEGGFMADVLLFTEDEVGAMRGAALIPQAFHGIDVPMPIKTIRAEPRDLPQLLEHARAFMPFSGENPNDPFDGMFRTRYSTLLTANQMAAYSTPALLQEGVAKIIMPIPKGMGFYPQMDGDIVLGHQYSPDTGDLTTAPVRLSKERFMHTMFSSNTGFGKSVGATRMVREIAYHWGMRCVVLDFGFAWRSLLNAPGIEDRVDIRQLRPDGVRPLRWNPLRISTYISPEIQLKAFADIFGNLAQLGQKQQQHRLLDAIRQVYKRAGVMVNDPDVWGNADWGHVRGEEVHLLAGETIDNKSNGEDIKDPITQGTLLMHLTRDQRQILAVQRSRKVGLADVYKDIEANKEALPQRDTVGRGVLDGILWRLEEMVNGGASAQFAADSPGSETIAIEDLGRPNGVVILEGGKYLDNFSKAFLLGWAGYLMYIDMVARREKQLNMGEANAFFVYEEANIIFGGLDSGGDAETRTGPTVSEQQSAMLRDSRKYGCYFGIINQSPSEMPMGIRTSCNNQVVGFITDPKDKDVVLSAIGKSEKGFRDEEWRRFVSDESIGMMIGRLPYVHDRRQQLPFLFRPLILDVPEPSDADIESRLGRIEL
jgi:hypothetical protein